MNIYLPIFLVLPFFIRSVTILPYDFQWETLNSTTHVQKNTIYCYEGLDKTIEKLWWKLEIHAGTTRGLFRLYTGSTPEEVYNDYKKSWFQPNSKSETLELNPFYTNCVFVDSTENCQVQVILRKDDRWRVTVMATGIIMIFASKFLSRNPLVFYTCASIFGVIALVVALLYFMSQRSIKQSIGTVMLITGWSGISYFFRQSWSMEMNEKYILRYIVITGFLSFLVAYKVGPPTSPRSTNIMMWVIQAMGVAMILWSTWYEEASLAIAITSLAVSRLFQCLVKTLRRRPGHQMLNMA